MNNNRQQNRLRSTLATLTLLCSASAAGTVELEIGKTYQGNTLIEAKTYGLEFTVPEGWSGMLPPGGTFFAMTPDNKTFVFATAEPGSIKEAQGSLSQPLPLGNGITLQPIGTPEVQDSGFTINYNVLGASEPLGSEGRAIVSETGVIAGFIGITPQAGIDDMRRILDAITEGVAFDELD